MKRPGTMAAVLFALLLLALCRVTPTATADDRPQQDQIDRLQRDLANLREEIRLLRIQMQLNSKLSDAETKTMIASGPPRTLLEECPEPKVRRFLKRGEEG